MMVFTRLDLELAGYDLDAVTSVEKLIEQLEAYSQSAVEPDLVLLDVMMPITPAERAQAEVKLGTKVLSFANYKSVGLGLAELVIVSLPRVPIVAYTNLGEETETGSLTLRALRALQNVKSVLRKPVQLAVLQNTIESAIEEAG
jgi:CheY-like chemotaxis protein